MKGRSFAEKWKNHHFNFRIFHSTRMTQPTSGGWTDVLIAVLKNIIQNLIGGFRKKSSGTIASNTNELDCLLFQLRVLNPANP